MCCLSWIITFTSVRKMLSLLTYCHCNALSPKKIKKYPYDVIAAVLFFLLFSAYIGQPTFSQTIQLLIYLFLYCLQPKVHPRFSLVSAIFELHGLIFFSLIFFLFIDLYIYIFSNIFLVIWFQGRCSQVCDK